MELVTAIFGGITISVLSGAIGKSYGASYRVKEKTCVERREACILLVSEKIDNLVKEVSSLKDVLNKSV